MTSIEESYKERTIYTFKIELAHKKIVIECFNKQHFQFCRNYLSTFDTPDYTVSVSQTEISNEINKSPFFNIVFEGYKEGIATEFINVESSIIYRKIADQMANDGILLIHGAAISTPDGKCYIFAAPSGTGKTTHILNWLKMIPGTIVINGDKPLIDTSNGFVFGTPWCGKENMNTNVAAHIAGIIILERGITNSIMPISFKEMLPIILKQIYIPNQRESAIRCYKSISSLQKIPCYRLICNQDEESALVAYRGLNEPYQMS